MDIAKIGNRTKRRKNVKLYEITIPAQTVRIEATAPHVAVGHMWEQMTGYEIREILEDERSTTCPLGNKEGEFPRCNYSGCAYQNVVYGCAYRSMADYKKDKNEVKKE